MAPPTHNIEKGEKNHIEKSPSSFVILQSSSVIRVQFHFIPNIKKKTGGKRITEVFYEIRNHFNTVTLIGQDRTNLVSVFMILFVKAKT